MLALGQIEAEACADERAAGFRIGIGGEDPALVAAIAEEVHEVGEAEPDLGRAEVEQGLDGCGNGLRVWRRLRDGRRSGFDLRDFGGRDAGGIGGRRWCLPHRGNHSEEQERTERQERGGEASKSRSRVHVFRTQWRRKRRKTMAKKDYRTVTFPM